VPIGFVCDHTEILFDIDVQAREPRASWPRRCDGPKSLNTSPTSWPCSKISFAPAYDRRRHRRRGIAGLATAAYELSRHACRRRARRRAAAGGVILSEEIDGFTIDGGPDALLIQKPEGIGLCEELGLGACFVPTKLPRVAYIQRGGRLHALPAASVLGIPTRAGPSCARRCFPGPANAGWARNCSSRGGPTTTTSRSARYDAALRPRGATYLADRSSRASTPATRSPLDEALSPRLVDRRATARQPPARVSRAEPRTESREPEREPTENQEREP